MQTTSVVPFVEEQLDLTLRLLLGVSASTTPDELESVCQRLSHMHYTVARLLAAKTLESEGTTSTGSYTISLSLPLYPL